MQDQNKYAPIMRCVLTGLLVTSSLGLVLVRFQNGDQFGGNIGEAGGAKRVKENFGK